MNAKQRKSTTKDSNARDDDKEVEKALLLLSAAPAAALAWEWGLRGSWDDSWCGDRYSNSCYRRTWRTWYSKRCRLTTFHHQLGQGILCQGQCTSSSNTKVNLVWRTRLSLTGPRTVPWTATKRGHQKLTLENEVNTNSSASIQLDNNVELSKGTTKRIWGEGGLTPEEWLCVWLETEKMAPLRVSSFLVVGRIISMLVYVCVGFSLPFSSLIIDTCIPRRVILGCG